MGVEWSIIMGKPTMWARSTEIKQKNPLRVFFEKKASRKTQNRKLIDTYRREKCVFGRRSKQKNPWRVFFERKASKKTQTGS